MLYEDLQNSDTGRIPENSIKIWWGWEKVKAHLEIRKFVVLSMYHSYSWYCNKQEFSKQSHILTSVSSLVNAGALQS